MTIELNISYALKFYLTLYSDWKVSINTSILQMSKLWLTKKFLRSSSPYSFYLQDGYYFC